MENEADRQGYEEGVERNGRDMTRTSWDREKDMKGKSRGKPVVSRQFKVMQRARTSRQLRGGVTLQCRER